MAQLVKPEFYLRNISFSIYFECLVFRRFFCNSYIRYKLFCSYDSFRLQSGNKNYSQPGNWPGMESVRKKSKHETIKLPKKISLAIIETPTLKNSSASLIHKTIVFFFIPVHDKGQRTRALFPRDSFCFRFSSFVLVTRDLLHFGG